MTAHFSSLISEVSFGECGYTNTAAPLLPGRSSWRTSSGPPENFSNTGSPKKSDVGAPRSAQIPHQARQRAGTDQSANLPLPCQNTNVSVKPKSISFFINFDVVLSSNPRQSYTSFSDISLAPVSSRLNSELLYFFPSRITDKPNTMDP